MADRYRQSFCTYKYYSQTHRELAERKDTYLLCSSELAAARQQLNDVKKEVSCMCMCVSGTQFRNNCTLLP
jgi:hypothetical protein